MFRPSRGAAADTLFLLAHALTARVLSCTGGHGGGGPARSQRTREEEIALGGVLSPSAASPRLRPAHSIVVLGLRGCALGRGDGFAVLCAALAQNETVAALDVSDNQLGEAAAACMAALLRQSGSGGGGGGGGGCSSLAKLCYADNGLGGLRDKAPLGGFCAGLGANRSLAHVDLSRCNLLASDSRCVAAGLASNGGSLLSIDLRGNALGAEGKMQVRWVCLRSRSRTTH